MSDIRKVGFIGIGNMGWPMAANLVRAGHDVAVYDIAVARAEAFAAAHAAHVAKTVRDLVSCDMAITMLPTGRDVRQVLLETDGGVAAHLRAGSIVVDMSSADPVGTRDLGKALAVRGIALVDAPVSGGVPGATDGTLAIMIGGEPEAVAAVKPLLACMGNRLFDVGGLGSGHAMKALNNFLAATSIAAACEAVRVGREFGLDPGVMVDVVNVSTGRSFASDKVIKQHVLSGAFSTGFALGLLAKDVKIAADLAAQIGVDAPLGRMICDLYGEARDVVGGDRDHTQAAIYWEQRGLRRAAE